MYPKSSQGLERIGDRDKKMLKYLYCFVATYIETIPLSKAYSCYNLLSEQLYLGYHVVLFNTTFH